MSVFGNAIETMQEIRLQNENLASELEKTKRIVIESEGVDHLKEYLYSKIQRAETSTQTFLSEIRKSSKREKSTTISRGYSHSGGSRNSRRCEREISSLSCKERGSMIRPFRKKVSIQEWLRAHILQVGEPTESIRR